MRFFLILLQLAAVCLLLSLVGLAGELALVSAAQSAGRAAAEIFGPGAALQTLKSLALFSYVGIASVMGVGAISAALTPLLAIAALCFVCAVLAGYKHFWWLRWVGFIINLALGLLALLLADDQIYLPPVLFSLYFLAQAFMFYLLPQKCDAERIRKAAALLHPLLGVMGLGLGFFVLIAQKYGSTTFILTALLYSLPFFLHYRVSRALELQGKSLLVATAVLALTLAALLGVIIVRPAMAGPLLLSWLSIPVYMETLALFKIRADFPYLGWRQQLRKSAKLLIIILALVALLAVANFLL